jgi:hypothetical protein
MSAQHPREAGTGAPIDWLVESEPFVEYRTRADLLRQPESDSEVRSVRAAMLADPRVAGLVAELAGWPGTVIASHKSASQQFHKLTFLADLGLTVDDPGVERIVSAVLAHQSDEGPFLLSANVAQSHGGSGTEVRAWALCDAPLIVYGLAKLGLQDDPSVRAAINHLVGLSAENGWPCAVSKELGKFRGPGRKDDSCPFATLAMLKALAQFEDLRDCSACHVGAESLLALWDESRTRHPYMFYMGTDFWKLKAPFIWYDLLHVLDVLSQFPWLTGDVRYVDMLDTLRGKADEHGCFTSESVWTAWKAWEFGQKKVPSAWVTMLAWRVIGRQALLYGHRGQAAFALE